MVGRPRTGGDNGRVEIDVGRGEFVEQVACIGEVAEASGAEADELEGVELDMAVAERDDMGLELFEVIEIAAFVEDCAYMPVEAARRNHVMFLIVENMQWNYGKVLELDLHILHKGES